MSFVDLLTEDRRLVLLRLLDQAPAAQANTYVLATGLRSMGHDCSQDQVETDAAWLAEQGLVAVKELESVRVVQLTARGADVAAGRARVPGVKRPVPGV
ncbi:MAG: ArsR family transcriptional regulator [Pseudodesulfovibrio sp.]|uniref:VpaChn25_0724 family phage protein n=1 Tax=Pseudodesulfovibrio sp. TaxID=2035812 RepID=UPI003D0CA033